MFRLFANFTANKLPKLHCCNCQTYVCNSGVRISLYDPGESRLEDPKLKICGPKICGV